MPKETQRPNQVEQMSNVEVRSQMIIHYLDRIIASRDESVIGDEEYADIIADYEDLPLDEKVHELYQKLMTYDRAKKTYQADMTQSKIRAMKDKRKVVETVSSDTIANDDTVSIDVVTPADTEFRADAYLVAEIAALRMDNTVVSEFAKRFATAREEQIVSSRSTTAAELHDKNVELDKVSHTFTQLQQQLNLGKITSESERSTVESKLRRAARRVHALESDIDNLLRVDLVTIGESDYCISPESVTNDVAQHMFELMQEYAAQAKEGFVWLPHYKEILKKIENALLNHRWPMLTGEAGAGKSELVKAAAKDMTGDDSLALACDRNTDATDITGGAEMIDGESYTKFGPATRAYLGYADSRKGAVRESDHGRIVLFDEFTRMGDKAYALLKELRQLKPGDTYHGRTVLPGASAICTTNPAGPRYPGRTRPDVAMQRELAEIYTGYPPMTNEDPQLYEFMVSVMIKDQTIPARKKELSPAFVKTSFDTTATDVTRTVDGTLLVAATSALESDATNKEHGVLWRFSHAVHAIQRAFEAGNIGNTHVNRDALLRYHETSNGIEVVPTGGELLTLDSTITLGEVASWLSTYSSRRQKADQNFHVESLTEWIQFKLTSYIDSLNGNAEKEKIRAIFEHYHLFDTPTNVDTTTADVVTQMDIGYLTPRTPRPAELVAPELQTPEVVESADTPTVEAYTDTEYITKSGDTILVTEGKEIFVGPRTKVTVKTTTPLFIDGEHYRYIGTTIVNGDTYGVVAPHNTPDIAQVLDSETLDKAAYDAKAEALKQSFADLMKHGATVLQHHCGITR